MMKNLNPMWWSVPFPVVLYPQIFARWPLSWGEGREDKEKTCTGASELQTVHTEYMGSKPYSNCPSDQINLLACELLSPILLVLLPLLYYHVISTFFSGLC